MADDSTAVCNLALMRMGQNLIDDIDGSDVLEEKCKLIYPQSLGETLVMGPELGWKFAKGTYHGIDVDSITIASIADSTTSGDITITGTHALIIGDMVELKDTEYDNTYDVKAISTTATFDVTATFAATDTGTAYWRSGDFAYRFLIPTCKKVVKVKIGGVELTDWIKRGAYVLTNQEADEVDMEIIQDVTTVTLFPDHFVRVLALKLAVDLTYDITQDLQAAGLIETELREIALPKAVAMDERERYVKEYNEDWVNAGR